MRTIRAAFLTLSLIVYGLPLYLSLVNLFKTTDQIGLHPIALPLSPTLENFRYVLTNPNVELFEMYGNTLVITVASVLATIALTSMAAFYTSRSRSMISKFLGIYFIVGLMVPYAIVYIPMIVIFKHLHLVGSLQGLIYLFISGNIPFAFFMYNGFMKSTPKELEESAAIDGAGQFRTYWQIVLPLLKPCTATVAIFTGLSVWNDFLTPLVIGQVKTISLGIYTAIGPYSSDWGHVFAFVFFGSFPVVIAYLLAQKQFVSGLTAGALKG